MVATTPIAGLRYAQQTDTANAETGFHNLASDVDTQLIPRYATVAARTAAIPSPINGQAAYITDTATGGRTLTIYNGSTWAPHFRAPLFAYKTADETINNVGSAQDDEHLVVAVEANAIYTVEVNFIYNSNTTADIFFNLTWPANGAMSVTQFGPGTNSTTNPAESLQSSAVTNDTTSPTTAILFGGTGSNASGIIKGLLVTGITSGNVLVRWAQAVADPSNTIIRIGSYIRLDRVA